MQVNRFEPIQIDRADKSNIAIIDHKTDEHIIAIHSGNLNQEDTQKVAAKIIDSFEELILNKEINYE